MLIKGFAFDEVKIKEPVLLNAYAKEQDYLLSLEADRLLAGFLETAGLEKKADRYTGGWENSELSGHTLGHYMVALAQMYAASEAPNIKARLEYVIDELAKCQAEDGYLFTSGVEIFEKLEKGGLAWMPWYNMHKLLTGLLTVYRLVGISRALDIAKRLGGWICERVLGWTDKARRKTLSIADGGMNDCLYEMYKETGEDVYLEAAAKFEDADMFQKIADGQDVLPNKHANNTIPKFLGALNRYMVKGESEAMYLQAAESFFDIVEKDHTYITGGNGELDHFRTPGALGADRTQCNCETCSSYNMLKLAERLYTVTGKKRYMDFYERTFINSILGSMNPEDGMTTFYQPMEPGYFKTFAEPYSNFWCCTGTGMESFTKLNTAIYHQAGDRLYVNRYVASELVSEEFGLRLTQNVTMEEFETVAFALKMSGVINFTLCLRIPEWSGEKAEVTVNGQAQDAKIKDGYLLLDRAWENGDKVELKLFPKVQIHPLPDIENCVAATYGPYVLAAGLGTEDMSTERMRTKVVLPTKNVTVRERVLLEKELHLNEWFADCDKNFVKRDGEIAFTLQGTDADGELVFVPYYKIYNERYGIYFTYHDEENLPDDIRAMLEEQKRLEEERLRREAEEAERLRKEEEERLRREEEERLRREEEERLRREAEEAERRRLEEEERLRREAEEAERRRLEEEERLRREAEEAERRRLEEEERLRREAEEAERLRLEEEERKRREAEEAARLAAEAALMAELERQRREEEERRRLEEEERLRREAEEAERLRLEEEERKRREAEEAERLRLEEEERLRREAEEAERRRLEEEERLRREAEEAERLRLEEEERKRREAEEAARLAAEAALMAELERQRREEEARLAEEERLRREAEEAERRRLEEEERARREAEEAERRRIEEEERARVEAEEAERRRLEEEEKARLEAEEAERLRLEAEEEEERQIVDEAKRIAAQKVADAERAAELAEAKLREEEAALQAAKVAQERAEAEAALARAQAEIEDANAVKAEGLARQAKADKTTKKANKKRIKSRTYHEFKAGKVIFGILLVLAAVIALYVFATPISKGFFKGKDAVDTFLVEKFPGVAEMLKVKGNGEGIPMFKETDGVTYVTEDAEAFVTGTVWPQGYQASVARLNGKQYICIEGNGVKTYYLNEIAENDSKHVYLETASEKALYFWEYTFANPEELCPRAGQFNSSGVEQYAFFYKGDVNKLHVLNADTLEECTIILNAETAASVLSVDVYREEADCIRVDLKAEDITYAFAVPKKAGAALPDGYRVGLADFDYTLSEEGIRFEAYVVSADSYLGKMIGELNYTDRVYTVEKFGFYAYAGEEWGKSDGKTVFSATDFKGAQGEKIEVRGDDGEQLLVPLLDGLKRNEYDKDSFLTEKNGEMRYILDGKTVSVKGIDVSGDHGTINWDSVAASGVEYAMIRLGVRGDAANGKCQIDPNYTKNIKNALKAGVEVGVSFTSRATTVDEAKEEAQYVLNNIKDYDVTWPVAVNVVEAVGAAETRATELSAEKRTACVEAFMKEIAAAGYTPVLYADARYAALKFDMETLAEYDVWYCSEGALSDYPYQYTMWQYLDGATVPGIEENVDLNISFVDYGEAK